MCCFKVCISANNYYICGMKALAILRVSTAAQQIDDQREELFSFIKAQGYDEIVPIEAVGASAIKMDDKYMELVEKVKETILTDKDVKAACVWELSRLGRNEVILMEFKEFFISHNIQFICKNPYMKLLEDDGSVNAGMELAFSLFATMTKQEMAEKKARFRRAKKANAAKGKYIGGATIPYGYTLDDNLFFIEKEEESAVIKTAFELYATGKYSSYTLAEELRERGYDLNDYTIGRILKNKAYIGEEVGTKYPIHYPPIISKELFEEVAKIRSANKIDMKKNANPLGAKLVRCYRCGAVCTSNSRHYVCCRHAHHGKCDNGVVLRQCVVDNLLWRVAQVLNMEYLLNLNDEKADEYRKEIEILDQKIAAVQVKIDKIEDKRKRIVESYMEGYIDKETRDLRLSKTNSEGEDHMRAKALLQEKRSGIAGILKSLLEDMDIESAYGTAATSDYSDKEKYDIIHKHILKVTGHQVSFGKRDPRTHLPNGVEITITDVRSVEWKYMYIPKFYQKHNLYVWNGTRWVADMVEITDKLKREGL